MLWMILCDKNKCTISYGLHTLLLCNFYLLLEAKRFGLVYGV